MAINMINFVGQEDIRKDLHIHMTSSLVTNRPLDHVLLYGPPGLGKTTLSSAIAWELGAEFFQKTGDEMNKESLFELLIGMSPKDILFIDEIHNMPVKVMEILYGPLQIINNMKLENSEDTSFMFEGIEISPFTLIGATTYAGMITKPLRDRIILAYELCLYKIEELIKILTNKGCPYQSAEIIAERSRKIPRVALNYFVRIRNEAILSENITPEICESTFDRNNIDEKGYTSTDRVILEFLYENGDTSEPTLCKTLNIDKNDLMSMHEPFLLSNRLITITSRGRSLTKAGIEFVERYS